MRCLKSSAHSTSAVLIVAFRATPLHFASAQQNKSHRGFPDGFKMHGAGNRNRTRNPLITNVAYPQFIELFYIYLRNFVTYLQRFKVSYIHVRCVLIVS